MIKKWRTIPKALAEVRELDPDNALTDYALRKMVEEKKINHLKNGRHILIDMNEVWGIGAEES